jgi:hypothetical protein
MRIDIIAPSEKRSEESDLVSRWTIGGNNMLPSCMVGKFRGTSPPFCFRNVKPFARSILEDAYSLPGNGVGHGFEKYEFGPV